LPALPKKLPDWDVVVLVQTEEEEKINAAWPNAQVVLGDLDDAETLSDEASKANVVLSRVRLPLLQSTCSETDNPHFQILPMLCTLVVQKSCYVHGLSKHEPGQCLAYPETNSDQSLQISGMPPAPSSTVVLSNSVLLSLSRTIHSATCLFPCLLAHLI
jgi:hypothetical protein